LSEIAALLVHGAGGGGWEWRIWQGVWRAHGIAATAPDLQPAPADIDTTQWQDYDAQVGRALDALPRPRVLVGASLGGLLAMRHASAADALVLINPLPPSPWHRELPARDWPDVVRWRRDARLDSSRRAMADADMASVLFAFRHWRDESGAVLRQVQAGIHIARPACPVLVMASSRDDDAPPATTRALAAAWQADAVSSAATTHVGPLLGRSAAADAAQAVAWVNARLGAGRVQDAFTPSP